MLYLNFDIKDQYNLAQLLELRHKVIDIMEICQFNEYILSELQNVLNDVDTAIIYACENENKNK